MHIICYYYFSWFFFCRNKCITISKWQKPRVWWKNLCYKKGHRTGKTHGLLKNNSLSINFSLCRFPGRLFIFKICYEIRNKWPSCPFFQEGDSGSGIVVIENGQPSNPLGIAFAFQSGGEITVVCKVNSILHACKLAICQEEIEMDL